MLFTATDDGGRTVVSVSFMQCAKAGFAFACGAALASVIAYVLLLVVAAPLFLRLLAGAIR